MQVFADTSLVDQGDAAGWYWVLSFALGNFPELLCVLLHTEQQPCSQRQSGSAVPHQGSNSTRAR